MAAKHWSGLDSIYKFFNILQKINDLSKLDKLRDLLAPPEGVVVTLQIFRKCLIFVMSFIVIK